MTNPPERPTRADPTTLLCVDVSSTPTYDSTALYPLKPAADVVPDASLAGKKLGLTLLNFYAGDLPGEDDWDGGILTLFQRATNRAREQRDKVRARNEVFIKLGVDYWTPSGEPGRFEGPRTVDYGFQFVVQDNTRAGRFTDKRIFDGIQIQDALVLRVELQELDDVVGDFAPYTAVLKDTGLDQVLNLSRYNPILGVASTIARNIARLNKADVVWDEALTITTQADAVGQSHLQAGMYVLTSMPEDMRDHLSQRLFQSAGDGSGAVAGYGGLVMRGHQVFIWNDDGKLLPWPLTYLVFNIHRMAVPAGTSTPGTLGGDSGNVSFGMGGGSGTLDADYESWTIPRT